MFIIKYPTYCIKEYSYILKVFFTEFLGIEYRCIESEDEWVAIEYENKQLKILNVFFRKSNDDWLGKETLPKQPLKVCNTQEFPFEITLSDPQLPIIYGKCGWHDDGRQAELNIDIFGSVFFMLSRYEEAVKLDRDNHDRFPAMASLAYQEGFLDRPIVNEYIEILWATMKNLWPQLERKKRISRTLISCDVDHPYLDGIKSLKRQIRQTGGDLFKRKAPMRMLRGVVNYFNAKCGDLSFDVNYTAFDWMMDVNETVGNKVAFYFKSDQTDMKFDASYSLSEPVIERLMRRIHARGHEIGLHPSYNTYLDQQQTVKEADRLRQAIDKLGICQNELGGRQHYLRWKTPQTARNLAAAEMSYDSTLTFADRAGFRCGICYEYPMYDLKERQIFSVRQRPLIVMECTLLSTGYCLLNSEEEMLEQINILLQKTRMFKGDFTLLWHNSYFEKKWYRDCYKNAILLTGY